MSESVQVPRDLAERLVTWANFTALTYRSSHAALYAEEAERSRADSDALAALLASSGVGSPEQPDTLTCNVHSLSGHRDAELDHLGHTDVSSLDWLREFQQDPPSGASPVPVQPQTEET